MDKNHLVNIAKHLKQSDKLKVFDIMIQAFANDGDLNNTLSQSLEWCEKLCDIKNN